MGFVSVIPSVSSSKPSSSNADGGNYTSDIAFPLTTKTNYRTRRSTALAAASSGGHESLNIIIGRLKVTVVVGVLFIFSI